jgi:hypothetical protein
MSSVLKLELPRMAEPQFRILIGDGNVFSPLSHQPVLRTVTEAKATARAHLEERRKVEGTTLPLQARVEETLADGSVVRHVVV